MAEDIIANPCLKQITQNEQRLCRAVLEITLQGLQRGWLGAIEVQIREKIDRVPVWFSTQHVHVLQSSHRHDAGPMGAAGLQRDCFVDDHSVKGHVIVVALACGAHFFDGIHNLLALDHFAEYGVAPALPGRSGVVEELVVHYVDEKLCCRAVGIAGAGHGNRVSLVFQAIGGFVLNRSIRVFLLHVGSKATTLDHEVFNHTVKNRTVVVALVHVLEEIGGALRCIDSIQLQGDHAWRSRFSDVDGDVQFNLRIAHGG